MERIVTRVDLNCDLGEGQAHDAELMSLITSANIACGGHAGDETTMLAAVAQAMQCGVAIGAHPGFEDRDNFGRRELRLPAPELRAMLLRQIERLGRISPLQHVKLHGALYNLAARDRRVADEIVNVIVDFDPTLRIYALAGSELVRAAREKNLPVAEEVFADRTYQADGSLTPRSDPRALIESETDMIAQVLEMVGDGTVTAVDGARVKIRADTICLHGDGPHAVRFAQLLRDALRRNGVEVRRVG